jgi:hypothetical protein
MLRMVDYKRRLAAGDFWSRSRGGFCLRPLFGVGLSLNSLWCISVAPVRGGTYFLCLPCRKESRQRKRLHTASFQAGPPAWRGQWHIWKLCPRAFNTCDKAVILPASRHALAGTVCPKPGAARVRARGIGFAPAMPRNGLRFGRRPPRTEPALREMPSGAESDGREQSRAERSASPGKQHMREIRPRLTESLGIETTDVLRNDRDGARSAAGRMSALSRTRNARRHRFQMCHCPLQAWGPA